MGSAFRVTLRVWDLGLRVKKGLGLRVQVKDLGRTLKALHRPSLLSLTH